MSGITPSEVSRTRETELKRQRYELRNLKEQFKDEYDKVVEKNEAFLERIGSEFKQIQTAEETETERKLIDLRNKQKQRLQLENQRLNQEVSDLKMAHNDQVSELRETQEYQLNDMNKTHKSRIENARLEFEKEQAKYSG